MILLCTNGLTDVADNTQIATTLRLHSTPDDQSRALVNLAISLGGKHDVTALVADYHILREAAPHSPIHEQADGQSEYPNVWFGNVERIASGRIGRETLTCV